MPESDRTPVDPRQWPILGAVAVGGVIGAEGRLALQWLFPHPPGGFAWATFAINIAGSALLGALMVLVTEVWPDRALLRPLLGTGVLGGFTTFSSYTVEVQHAVAAGHHAAAAAYLVSTVIVGLLAVWAGSLITASVVRRTGAHR